MLMTIFRYPKANTFCIASFLAKKKKTLQACVTVVPSLLSCSGSLILSFLCWVSYSDCPSCPVPTSLSRLSCSDYLVPAILNTSLMTLLSCRCCHVLACPRCSVQADLSRLICPGYPVLLVLSQMSYPDCHSTAVLRFLSWLYYPNCLLWLSYPTYLVQAFLLHHSCSHSPVLAVMSWHLVLSILSWLNCPG